jgi:NADPH-dependent 2,4-dienoyl-CoA reductase/sulfur reductase-like enzyme
MAERSRSRSALGQKEAEPAELKFIHRHRLFFRSLIACILGGGPGGLECALIAAQRGHSVVLCEKGERLGGQLIPASKEIGGGHIFVDLVRYYETVLKKWNVDVRLATEVTPQLCAQIAPDVAVVATGSEIGPLPIPGAARNHVVIAHNILEEGSPCGDRVVVLGGERIGLVAADYLASRGKRVTIAW